MDAELRLICKDLHTLSSPDALALLLDRYPPGSRDVGRVLQIIGHRSWSKREQAALYVAYFPLGPVRA